MGLCSEFGFDKISNYATWKNFAYISSLLAIFKFAQLCKWAFHRVFSPLRRLAGPSSDNIIFGNAKRIFDAPIGDLHEEWIEKYGPTYAFHDIMLSYHLFTTDVRALTFILSHNDTFPKPESLRRHFEFTLGKGLLFAEFDIHKRQRRLMNPSFGPPQIRALMPTFWDKANKLRDIWLDLMKGSSEGVATIDVLPWLSRATLDIIGVAGFDYHFNSLQGEDNELAKSFAKVFGAGQSLTPFAFIKKLVPILSLIPDASTRRVKHNKEITHRIGMKLVEEKKAALTQEFKTGSTAQGRDLLTLLIKSNLAYENEGQRMTDEEVMGQISTFLVAGHETTSTATTWILYALSKHPEVQHKLRQELLESRLGDEPSMVDLDKLSYLDHIVRESMRIHPAVASTVREVAEDTHIPVSQTFKDRYGSTHTHITVQKGDTIMIPIHAMNRSREIWGEDANIFRPERWDHLPEAAKEMPGIWGRQMTFISGPHSCIGYRFAVIEMKALIYSLIRAVEFDINPKIVIEGQPSIVTRPRVASEREKGNQMPLLCKPVLTF